MCKNPDPVDETPSDTPDARLDRIRPKIMAHRDALARQGCVVASWQTHQGRKLGPYFRLAFREAGKQVSVYLGKCGELAEKVRALLTELQASTRLDRIIRRATSAGKAALRECKGRVRSGLEALGLYARGWKVFGWRNMKQKHPFPTFEEAIRAEEARAFKHFRLPWPLPKPGDTSRAWAKALKIAPKLPRLPSWAKGLAPQSKRGAAADKSTGAPAADAGPPGQGRFGAAAAAARMRSIRPPLAQAARTSCPAMAMG